MASQEAVDLTKSEAAQGKLSAGLLRKTDTVGTSRFLNSFHTVLFFAVHGIAFAAIWTGISWAAAIVCVALYFVRMFAITAGYHRYFSHRSYKTSRWFQFVLGFIGASSAQKGPIWWASHHRHHHQHSDEPDDVHSPRHDGLWWAHVGWVLSSQFVGTRHELVRDLEKYPELRWLDRYHVIAPVMLGAAVFFFGVWAEAAFPAWNTNGWQMLVVGFFLSTVLLYHGTFLVNSLTHMWGSRRFETTDDSKNSLLIALVTLGEGWHNNHHRYPGSERQGFYWWEIDISHYMLKMLSWFRLVWDLRRPPKRIYDEAASQQT